MQLDSKLFDDLARMAAGAAGTAIGVRDEIEAQVRQQAERLLSRMDLVTRDEFEAAREMAAAARAEQEALTARLEALEARLAALEPAGEGRSEEAAKPAGGRRKGAPRNPAEGA
jgi:BMFP domain-containing protein YqiC